MPRRAQQGLCEVLTLVQLFREAATQLLEQMVLPVQLAQIPGQKRLKG
jgi:hypothetical protein